MSLLKVNTVQIDKLQSVAGVNRNSVLQVVSKEDSTMTVITSTSFVDAANMNISITPTSATSKIHVNFNVAFYLGRSTTSGFFAYRILRDDTEVFNPSQTNANGTYILGQSGVNSVAMYYMVPMNFIDSPSTTNEITYKLQASMYQNTSGGTLYVSGTEAGLVTTMTLMEIAQ